MTVRVRFAPSPTGYLHVGNVRTVLYNWLFARQKKGAFILRIEDTDVERSQKEYEEQLIEDLKWSALRWDEGPDVGGEYGPYRQSERVELYGYHAQKLLREEKLYYCFCSPEELEQEREKQLGAGGQPKYSGKCKGISRQKAEQRLAGGEKAALRLKVREGKVTFEDIVFGPIQVECSEIGDFVVLRSDGSAPYNFAAVVDDVLMKITHVIRGEGHISNTSRQVLVYEVLGFALPKFAHLSTILSKDGSKLSKRHGAASISEFRRQGYLPEALVNYLALLGWSPQEDGKEILTREQLTAEFDLFRVHRSPAVFDLEKLNWVNRSHLKKTERARLIELAVPYLQAGKLVPAELSPDVREWIGEVVEASLNYLNKLEDLERETRLIFRFNPEKDLSESEVEQILLQDGAREVIHAFAERIKEYHFLDVEAYREAVKGTQQATAQKGKNLFRPIRVALIAQASGPELEKLIPILERGSHLELPVKILGAKERAKAVVDWLERH